MKRFFQRLVNRLIDKIAERITSQVMDRLASFPDTVASSVIYAARLEALLKSALPQPPHELFGRVGDDFWRWINTEGYRWNPDLPAFLPALPDDKARLEVVGQKGDEPICQGFVTYQLFKQQYEKHRGRPEECQAVLDFGCGWGRILRFFLKDLDGERLWGVDPDPQRIAEARQTNPWCHFETIELQPPTPLPPAHFDWVFSYSVFSHLPEANHLEWLGELQRVLKPGGLLMATTWGRDFIEWLNDFRSHGIPPHDPFLEEHYRSLANLFQEADHYLTEFDAGHFCYEDLGTGSGSVKGFGEACIPKGYVLSYWTKYFSFVDYLDDRQLCPQNVIIVRK